MGEIVPVGGRLMFSEGDDRKLVSLYFEFCGDLGAIEEETGVSYNTLRKKIVKWLETSDSVLSLRLLDEGYKGPPSIPDIRKFLSKRRAKEAALAHHLNERQIMVHQNDQQLNNLHTSHVQSTSQIAQLQMQYLASATKLNADNQKNIRLHDRRIEELESPSASGSNSTLQPTGESAPHTLSAPHNTTTATTTTTSSSETPVDHCAAELPSVRAAPPNADQPPTSSEPSISSAKDVLLCVNDKNKEPAPRKSTRNKKKNEGDKENKPTKNQIILEGKNAVATKAATNRPSRNTQIKKPG